MIPNFDEHGFDGYLTEHDFDYDYEDDGRVDDGYDDEGREVA